MKNYHIARKKKLPRKNSCQPKITPQKNFSAKIPEEKKNLSSLHRNLYIKNSTEQNSRAKNFIYKTVKIKPFRKNP